MRLPSLDTGEALFLGETKAMNRRGLLVSKLVPHVVVTFHTTAEALGFRKIAEGSDALSGRLSAIPRQLSAGCGFAWREPAENEAALLNVIAVESVEYEALAKVDL